MPLALHAGDCAPGILHRQGWRTAKTSEHVLGLPEGIHFQIRLCSKRKSAFAQHQASQATQSEPLPWCSEPRTQSPEIQLPPPPPNGPGCTVAEGR
jgi:hypothetical protein